MALRAKPTWNEAPMGGWVSVAEAVPAYGAGTDQEWRYFAASQLLCVRSSDGVECIDSESSILGLCDRRQGETDQSQP